MSDTKYSRVNQSDNLRVITRKRSKRKISKHKRSKRKRSKHKRSKRKRIKRRSKSKRKKMKRSKHDGRRYYSKIHQKGGVYSYRIRDRFPTPPGEKQGPVEADEALQVKPVSVGSESLQVGPVKTVKTVEPVGTVGPESLQVVTGAVKPVLPTTKPPLFNYLQWEGDDPPIVAFMPAEYLCNGYKIYAQSEGGGGAGKILHKATFKTSGSEVLIQMNEARMVYFQKMMDHIRSTKDTLSKGTVQPVQPVMSSGTTYTECNTLFDQMTVIMTSILFDTTYGIMQNVGGWGNCNFNVINIGKNPSTCGGIINRCFIEERQYTWCWLLYLQMAFMGAKDGSELEITIANNLTGLWVNDINNIKLKIINGTDIQRLSIMLPVIGPSASGKTHMTGEILKQLAKSESMSQLIGANILAMISVDGGLMREASIVYRTISRACIMNGNLIGMTQLSSIHDTDSLKKNLAEFLSKNGHAGISLVIPDTGTGIMKHNRVGLVHATRAVFLLNNPSVHSVDDGKFLLDLFFKYMGELGFNKEVYQCPIIGCVWQHIEPSDCDYTPKCVGTKEKGETRGEIEGKKYSSRSWKFAKNLMDYFTAYIAEVAGENLPHSMFTIHNSGKAGVDSIGEFFSSDSVKKSIGNEFLRGIPGIRTATNV